MHVKLANHNYDFFFLTKMKFSLSSFLISLSLSFLIYLIKIWKLSCIVPAQDGCNVEVPLYFFIKNVKSVIWFFQAVLFPECMLTHESSVTFERGRSTNSLLSLHPALTL